MQRIRLRPYHPTYVVAYYGDGTLNTGRARAGFESIMGKLEGGPLEEIEVELVREHDDACAGCVRRWEAAAGSVWGQKHSCESAEDPAIVEAVDKVNEKVFGLLNLRYGSVNALPALAALLRERIPVLDDPMLGGPPLQAGYEKGLARILDE